MLAKLFPEILSYIMVLAQGSPLHSISVDEIDSDLDTPPQPFEITITHVNSHLRTVALHTCKLWSFIHVNTGVQSTRTVVERTETYLHRSGGHLLDLRIELNGSVGNYKNEVDLQRAMEMIGAGSKRWRRLTIVAEREGTAGVCDAVTARLSGAGAAGESLVPELEYLSVSVDYIDETLETGINGNEAPGLPHFHPHPHLDENPASTAGAIGTQLTQIPLTTRLSKLSFLRLRGLAIYLFRPTLLLSLRTLHLDQTKAIPTTYTLFGRIVAACPVLEHLSVYGDIVMPSMAGGGGAGLPTPFPVLGGVQIQHHYQQNGSSSSASGGGWSPSVNADGKGCDRVIRLPELRSLRICGTQGMVYKILLSRLEAPRLTSLVLKDIQERDLDPLWEEPLTAPSIVRGVGSFMTRPALRFTQLRSLIISNSNLSDFAYRRLFRAFPSITEFASYSSMELDIAPKLLIGKGADVPWPDLYALTFIFDVDLDMNDVAIEEILRQRRKYGCPIHRLCIGVAELDEGDATERRVSVVQGAIVVVKKLGEFDIWPEDRAYPDIDDVLF